MFPYLILTALFLSLLLCGGLTFLAFIARDEDDGPAFWLPWALLALTGLDFVATIAQALSL